MCFFKRDEQARITKAILSKSFEGLEVRPGHNLLGISRSCIHHFKAKFQDGGNVED